MNKVQEKRHELDKIEKFQRWLKTENIALPIGHLVILFLSLLLWVISPLEQFSLPRFLLALFLLSTTSISALRLGTLIFKKVTKTQIVRNILWENREYQDWKRNTQ